MASSLSLRAVAAEAVTCPFVRDRLARRRSAESPYVFDRPGIGRLVAAIVEAADGPPTPQRVDLVEVYTANKYCAAIEFQAAKTVILDYGFVELIADNVALEYLDHATAQALIAWNAAGEPETGPSADIDTFEVDGTEHHVTGTMMMRDVACKFLDDIVPDAGPRERLADRLLWRTPSGFRPNAVVHAALTARRPPVDVLPAFVADGAGAATLADQVALATAFVACHEIAHLAWTHEQQLAWRRSPFASELRALFDDLRGLPTGPDGPPLGSLTLAALGDPAIRDRVHGEAFVDLRALDMLIAHRRRDRPAPAEWGPWLANLFALVSMTNSLGIFRGYTVAAILQRSIAEASLQLARSEAVARNLLVLAYLELRHRELAGAPAWQGMHQRLFFDWLLLQRRTSYFGVDLPGFRTEKEWGDLIDSVLG